MPAIILGIVSSVGGAVHHVKSIGAANAEASPGDTVYIQAGTYNETLQPDRSGTAENYITFKPEGGDVILTTSGHAVELANRSYIVIDGLSMLDVGGNWVNLEPMGHHNIIQNCHMQENRSWAGLNIQDNANYNKILNNVFIGNCKPADLVLVWNASHNLIEGNTFLGGIHDALNIQDRINGTTSYNVIRNNYFQNKWHSNTDTWGVEYILFEGNTIIDGGEDAADNACGSERDRSMDRVEHKGLHANTRFGIYRRNIMVNNGSGLQLVSSTKDWKIPLEDNGFFHNTMSRNYIGIRNLHYYTATSRNNVVKNNIVYNNRDAEIAVSNTPGTADQYMHNNIYGATEQYAPGDARWDNISVHPRFADEFSRDFHLQSESPMIDAGGWLTTTVSAGSGVQIPVEDARYFMDGWGVIEGDLIQLQGQTRTARITGVDYDNNILTIDQNLTWSLDLGVSLPYHGSAPDIGAYEYGFTTGVSTSTIRAEPD